MYKPELFERLTPEQQKVALKWEQDRQARKKLFDKLLKHKRDSVEYQETLNELQSIDNWFCEHNRHIAKFCGECEDIERVLHPELFESEDEI